MKRYFGEIESGLTCLKGEVYVEPTWHRLACSRCFLGVLRI